MFVVCLLISPLGFSGGDPSKKGLSLRFRLRAKPLSQRSGALNNVPLIFGVAAVSSGLVYMNFYRTSCLMSLRRQLKEQYQGGGDEMAYTIYFCSAWK